MIMFTHKHKMWKINILIGVKDTESTSVFDNCVMSDNESAIVDMK